MQISHIDFDLESKQIHFQSSEQFKNYSRRFWFSKLLTQTDLFQSGDLCRHSAQSPDVLGQGGN